MFYQEGSSLDLDLIVQNYEEDRRRYWGYGEQELRFLALVDSLAATIFRGSQHLIEPDRADAVHPFSWEQVRILTEHEGFAERVFERLEIDVAWTFCTETRAMAYRSLELAKLVVAAQPSAPVVRFLSRLTRCYIAGFMPECVMLCRCVFENALKEKMGTRGTVRDRINDALDAGLLSPAGKEASLLIWARGNAAVHDNPDATQDVLELIRVTAKVLSEIYSGAPAA